MRTGSTPSFLGLIFLKQETVPTTGHCARKRSWSFPAPLKRSPPLHPPSFAPPPFLPAEFGVQGLSARYPASVIASIVTAIVTAPAAAGSPKSQPNDLRGCVTRRCSRAWASRSIIPVWAFDSLIWASTSSVIWTSSAAGFPVQCSTMTCVANAQARAQRRSLR